MKAVSSSGFGLEALTPRERQVLRLLGEHRTNDEMSLHLHVSSATIKNDVRKVLKKLGRLSRRQAARLALQQQERERTQAAPPPARHRTPPAILTHWDDLTPREQMVALMLADPQFAGLTDRALAVKLNVKPSTVKKHLQRIYRKFGVRNRASAALVAAQAAQGVRRARAELEVRR